MGQTLMDRLRAALQRATDGSDRAVALERFHEMIGKLQDQVAAEKTPPKTREKVRAFLGCIDDAQERLGVSLFQPAYLLNVVGDAMVRTGLISSAVVDFVQVGLYFHGLTQIDRRFAPRAGIYTAVHADLISVFVSRDSLQKMVEFGQAKLAGEKVFCLTYYYLNCLKKAYFQWCRQSQDALDHAMVDAGEVPESTVDDPSHEVVDRDPADRVGLMLDIFATKLSATQQLVYLAKNRTGDTVSAAAHAAPDRGEPFLQLLRELDRELDGHGNLGWSEIASKLSVNEKTAKREYLRALHVLLRESARAVLGIDIRSNYVRRVLEQLRVIVESKDLRIRDNSGDGLNRLVEKWEVALRFVLNHQRALA